MSIRDDHHRTVSFDTREESGTNRQFKPQIHQSRGRGRGQNMSYSQRSYQNRYTQNNRSNSRDRGQYRQDRSRPRYEPRYEWNYRRGNFRRNVRNYGRQNSREEYRNNYRKTVMVEVGTGPEIGHFFSKNYGNNRTRSKSNCRSRSGSTATINRGRICCYKCREYHHFTRDCSTSREKREVEQLQRMFNLGDE